MRNKVLLCAVNAKYIHSNLAVRYLKKYCESSIHHITLDEFSINDSINNILKSLYLSDADIYGFSCYIWNIRMVLDICSSLRKAKPGAVIILGGPEVSYDPESVLSVNEFIDYLVVGEGEASFLELLDSLTSTEPELIGIKGIAYRDGRNIIVNPPRPLIEDLSHLPFPYKRFDDLNNRIVYYETSRGCPFNCQYCLSSTIHGVRFLPLERIKSDIRFFIEAGVRQVKLVDRTFNCDIDRAVTIMEYIISLGGDTNFHFELAADLINDSFLDTARKSPAGLFQFEIGVQSTNPLTLHAIDRTMNFDKVSSNVNKLVSYGNSHIHLDLIAGLPYEDMESFRKSFNDVYSLHPDMLQLGFLKLLKGSAIREASTAYGMEYHSFTPYEVINTHWLTYSELLLLKDVEQVLEQYHNSGRFRNTLPFLLQSTRAEPFGFFLKLADYWNRNSLFGSSRNINELYKILLHFIEEGYFYILETAQLKLLNEYLKLDWLLFTRSGSMPEVITRYDHTHVKESIHKYMRRHLIEAEGFTSLKNASMRELLKGVGYEVFREDIFESGITGDIVLFYPLKQASDNRKPFYTVIPLVDISDKDDTKQNPFKHR